MIHTHYNFEPWAKSLLSAVMRAENACTASDLASVAVLRENCRASAERFAELRADHEVGFEELRTNANAYLQALQAILLEPKK